MRTKRWQNRVIRLVSGFLARLPLALNHLLGAGVGLIFWLSGGRMRRITEINLRLCFPEQSPRWRRQVARRSLMELGKAFTEAPWLWRAGPERLRALHPEELPYDLSAPRRSGQALFLVAPHLGSWEFAGLHAASYGPMTTLYSPIPLPEIDRQVHLARATTGAQLVPATRAGLRQLQAAQNRGEMIGMLPDQSPRRATGAYAPFFNQPALTMTLLPRLLNEREDIVIFAFAERLPWGRGYRYQVLTAGPEIADPNPEIAASEINHLVEALVRQCPEQYNWAYKRFNSPPEGHPDPYQR